MHHVDNFLHILLLWNCPKIGMWVRSMYSSWVYYTDNDNTRLSLFVGFFVFVVGGGFFCCFFFKYISIFVSNKYRLSSFFFFNIFSFFLLLFFYFLFFLFFFWGAEVKGTNISKSSNFNIL